MKNDPKKLNKWEFELEKLKLQNKRLEFIFSLIKFCVMCLTVLVSLFLVFWGLRPFIGQKASEINAFTKFIGALNIGNWISYLISAAVGAAWIYERNGKKRAIKQKAHYQEIAEATESERSSSGLTKTGDTPT